MKFGNWEVCNLFQYMFNEISYMVRVKGRGGTKLASSLYLVLFTQNGYICISTG